MNKVGSTIQQWVLTPAGWHLDEAVLRTALASIAAAGFDGIPSDLRPQDMDADGFLAVLQEYGLEPGPGYLMVALEDQKPRSEMLDAAQRHLETHLQFGLPDTFIAAPMSPERMALPAVGAAFDPDRLKRIIDCIAAVAEVLAAGGVRPALHQHVAGWIETEEEIEAVLAAIPPDVLAFGPDTGHLFWAGIDPAAIIARHSDRVGGIHLKDVHRAVADEAKRAGTAFFPLTMGQHLWTEPGRGDIDFDAVLDLVSPEQGYDGWYILEVDVPDIGDADASTAYCAQWANQNLRSVG
ncbi:MAG: sugar phosphate isomerase/epimerase [Propionibacteriaceae bacterium]|jgi:inosose dehydratase|nr:sugar phosphate isomerase/epimerase [Propionibacteriaceae bacterium]